jgi:hypothetical protein
MRHIDQFNVFSQLQAAQTMHIKDIRPFPPPARVH